MENYTVIRAHGDYAEGDTREADPREVAHLVGKCLVKMEAEPKNKAAKPVKNKGAK